MAATSTIPSLANQRQGSQAQSVRQLAGGSGLRRLDLELVSRGLAGSRAKAQKLITAGRVSVNGRPVVKPSAKSGSQDSISLEESKTYVSRGAYKLLGAFEAFCPLGLPSPKGLDCLDIGASTGGFSQVLLEAGAGRVLALDVGHGQLDPLVARHPATIEMSGVNIRDIGPQDLPFRPAFIVSDVSFISLTYVIPVIARIAAVRAQIVLLVKPQFEVGKDRLGRHGIVSDPQLRLEALEQVKSCARAQGMEVKGQVPSPIAGTHGNEEYLLYLQTA
ncbi:TlyA family rRNA (cytidine-2'-O)-methyltransferase [Bifidobacterium aemilianum]|uniref:TlyA family rRNA (Cytidine-2'-O)-methyltransferase n=2 Tax=Bifidobacterium aemilianum TaxID=2493120 RepID=A0A366KCH3_9BIFI|nr:TlyA family rRNA (cytidine-2'-O)-methyltransferase [Bifidobacterium aemilianum]